MKEADADDDPKKEGKKEPIRKRTQ